MYKNDRNVKGLEMQVQCIINLNSFIGGHWIHSAKTIRNIFSTDNRNIFKFYLF